MPQDEQPPTEPDSPFLEGRLMIDILAWDWNLRVTINPATVGPKARFQGLDYGRDFTLLGRISAPGDLRGKSIKVTLSPFGSKVRFGRGAERVGRVALSPKDAEFDLEGVLMLPEDAIATTATSLASTWKHLQIHTFDDDPQDVAAYFFSAAIAPNLPALANAD